MSDPMRQVGLAILTILLVLIMGAIGHYAEKQRFTSIIKVDETQEKLDKIQRQLDRIEEKIDQLGPK